MTSEETSGTILVIDDEEDILEFLEMLLGSRGFEVLGAQSGIEGLRMVREHEFDLILLDIRMAEVDGHEVCTRLRQSPGTTETPIIVLTAADRVTDLALCACEGATGFMTKPFNNRSLIDAVRRFLSPDSVPPVFSRSTGGELLIFKPSEGLGTGQWVLCIHIIEPQPIPFIRCEEPMDGIHMIGVAEHGITEGNRILTQLLVEVRDTDAFKGFLENIYAEGGNVAYCRMFKTADEIPSSVLGELTLEECS